MSLLEKLKMQLKRKHKLVDGNEEDAQSSASGLSETRNANAKKPSRKVEIGLMLFDANKEIFVQVRSKKGGGGGVRLITLSKSDTKADIINKAKKVFFNGEKWSLGKESEYEFELMYFHEVILEEGITVQNIIDATKVQKLRFYLAMKNRLVIDDTEAALDNIDTPANLVDVSENPADPIVAQVPNTLVLEQAGADIDSSDIHVYDQRYDVVFEDSAGEVQYLAQPGNFFGQNYMMEGLGLHAQTPVQVPVMNTSTVTENEPQPTLIKLHIGHVFKELREFFSKPMDVSKLNLKVELYQTAKRR